MKPVPVNMKDNTRSATEISGLMINQQGHVRSCNMPFILIYTITNESPYEMSDPKLKTNLLLLSLMLLTSVLAGEAECSSDEYKVYPLGEGILQKTYFLSNHHTSLFLMVTCKQPNIVSLAFNESITFVEAPRFDIYGHHPNPPSHHNIPLTHCPVDIQLTTSYVLQISRKNSSQPIFAISHLSFSKQHNRIFVEDDSTKWGLGERFQQHFKVTDGDWTIWNRDRPWLMDDGLKSQSSQTYGHQPVYLAKTHFSSQYHLVYFKNTHGMMVEARQESAQLVYNSVGGNVQFVIVVGKEDPEEVLQTYHQFIGKAHIPPFWSMGYHQSRWGYKSYEEIERVVDLFETYDIPLDGFWLDLDYMQDKKIFTVDSIRYPPNKLNQLIQDYSLKLVPLLDVAVAVNDRPAAQRGKKMNVFLRSPSLKEYYYTGEVWPGEVYYIDFLHPNASQYWQQNLLKLYKQINFSGIWLDMNQPTNFRGGDQIYQPFPIQKNQNINTMTIHAAIRHHSQRSDSPLFHSEVHAYYGHLSALPTFQFLQTRGRPFILTRSNSVGTGLLGAHWTGDNVANWDFLRLSISSNFLFQIFGIQMVGSDICGFYRNSNAELCSRWMQLGAFYPFARNHNHEASIPQQPYAFGDIHLQTSLLSFRTRYALLKQLYSWLVFKKGKGSFFRPLGFEFYEDQTTFLDFVIETQFLIGRSLMVAPIVEAQYDSRTIYFPGQKEIWYGFEIDMDSGSVNPSTIKAYPKQWNYNVQNILPSPPLTFLRSGFMLLTNRPESRSSLLSNDFFIFCALKAGSCRGQILGLSDYQHETKLSECIQQDCRVNISVNKAEEELFVLEWMFTGPSLDYELRILSVTIASEKRVWKLRGEGVIKGREGSLPLNSLLTFTRLR